MSNLFVSSKLDSLLSPASLLTASPGTTRLFLQGLSDHISHRATSLLSNPNSFFSLLSNPKSIFFLYATQIFHSSLSSSTETLLNKIPGEDKTIKYIKLTKDFDEDRDN